MNQKVANKVLEYYNTCINESEPVSLEWLKAQRTLDIRVCLEERFGEELIYDLLGEKSFLAKAEEMLDRVRLNNEYDLLPNIACNLAWECDTMLDSENQIRGKYSSLDFRIPIPIFEVPNKELDFCNLTSSDKQVTIQQLKVISNYFNFPESYKDPFKLQFFKYIQEVTLHVLQIALEEIKKEIQAKVN